MPATEPSKHFDFCLMRATRTFLLKVPLRVLLLKPFISTSCGCVSSCSLCGTTHTHYTLMSEGETLLPAARYMQLHTHTQQTLHVLLCLLLCLKDCPLYREPLRSHLDHYAFTPDDTAANADPSSAISRIQKPLWCNQYSLSAKSTVVLHHFDCMQLSVACSSDQLYRVFRTANTCQRT